MFRKLSFAPTYKTLLSTRQTAVAACRLSDFGRSTQACFPLFTHRGINYPPTSSVHPFSPERKTCYMLFISEAMAFLLSLSVSSSVILSFVPTYCNQLSTSRRLVPLSLQKGASFRKPNFFLASVFLRIHTAEEVQYITVILIDSHTVFYFPPGRPL